MTYVLWTLQVLLAALFLFAGGAKLVMSPEAMKGPVELPVLLLRFLGVVELLGAIGLILPALLRIKPGLTPLAAVGLVIIMTGAVVISVMGGIVAQGILPFVVGLVLLFIAYGRWRLAPISPR